jgi:hypothetical protein
MAHIVLLGDSIFDNAAYVRGAPPVIQQLRSKLPQDWEATLLAVDGHLVQDVHRQMEKIPASATHLIVSTGGNNALDHANILSESAHSAADVLSRLADVGEHFQHLYRGMLRGLMRRNLPLAACTIYYPNFPDAMLQRVATAALTTFNDVIISEAILAGVPLIDLRLVCSEAADYANEIEPSCAGGEKITGAIMKLVAGHRFECQRTEVFT